MRGEAAGEVIETERASSLPVSDLRPGLSQAATKSMPALPASIAAQVMSADTPRKEEENITGFEEIWESLFRGLNYNNGRNDEWDPRLSQVTG